MLNARQRPGDPDYFDLSMSGLKTAVMHAVQASSDLAADALTSRAGFRTRSSKSW